MGAQKYDRAGGGPHGDDHPRELCGAGAVGLPALPKPENLGFEE